tara:strand:- start:112 stop:360 length:249 start_codon:yes stop_codon:yes gene_type:complete
MSGQEQVEQRLAILLESEFPNASQIGKSEYFVDHNVMSSLDFMNLVMSLETTFAIRIGDDEISEENLGSTELILAFLSKKVL